VGEVSDHNDKWISVYFYYNYECIIIFKMFDFFNAYEGKT
jgi:hypothetical protein